LLQREEKISRKEQKISVWEDQQRINQDLQHQRDDEFKKRVEAENQLLEEKQKRIQRELESEKKKVEEEHRKLEEEKLALEEERLRVYDSGISSRADTADSMEFSEKPESPPLQRRRRRGSADDIRRRRRRQPEVGRAPPPDFEKVTPKIHSRDNRNYQPQGGRVKIFDDKTYMKKAKSMQDTGGGGRRRRRDAHRPRSLQMQKVDTDEEERLQGEVDPLLTLNREPSHDRRREEQRSRLPRRRGVTPEPGREGVTPGPYDRRSVTPVGGPENPYSRRRRTRRGSNSA